MLITGVNMKPNHEAQRYGNTALKTEKKMNRNPIVKVSSFGSVFSHRPRCFVARCVRKPQANTFPRTDLALG